MLSSAPWASSPEQLLADFEVNADAGLSQTQVLSSRARHGLNELQQTARRNAWLIVLDQLKSLVVALLLFATVLALVIGDVAEAAAIAIVIVLNTALGFFTELKATRSMEALRELGRVTTTVRRNGVIGNVPAEQLVPGDMVIIEAGDVISADLRLTKASRLAVDESALTGESVPVNKAVAAVSSDTHLTERNSVLHKGTVVTRGAAEGLVYATGLATQVGQIATLVGQAQAEQTPLEKRLARLGRQLVWLTLVLAVVMVVISVLTGRDTMLAIETSIALAVAAIPEGLPIVATLALARGMWRMAENNALISRLSAVETLGTTSIVLTDKTGTLTENKMAASRLLLPAGESVIALEIDQLDTVPSSAADTLQQLLRVVSLCSTASVSANVGVDANTAADGDLSPDRGGNQSTGDPTEVALLLLARQAGLERPALLKNNPELRQEPFDADRQLMATVHDHQGQYLVAVKGGPEAVLSVCTWLPVEQHQVLSLTDHSRQQWLQRSAELAESGLRVLAVAGKRVDDSADDVYANLTLFGLVGLWDPPRPDVASAISTCRGAGIRVVMVTGDHPATASHVAEEVGIVDSDAHDVIDGRSYTHAADLSTAEQARLLAADVIARSSPLQKLELIGMHQHAGHIVAMTGDGVNDAPALKKSDIGIAMGLRGTGVAKQAAAMVLQDDAFGSIVEAVKYGRAIYNNIRRFVLYLMSCNLSEILVVGIAVVVGAPLPLTPLQILFLNLVTDVFPALALGVNQVDPGVMERPPRPLREPIMTHRHWLMIVFHGLVISATVMTAMWFGSHVAGLSGAALTTVSFLTLALAQIWHVFNVRDRAAGWQAATLRNPWVWRAIVLCLLLIGLALTIPPIAAHLSLQWLPIEVLMVVVGLSFVPLLLGGAVTRLADRLAKQPQAAS